VENECRTPGRIDVTWAVGEVSGEGTSILDDCDRLATRHGYLTCDHAASSLGMPVLVAEDGTALGPADLAPGTALCSRYGQFHLADMDDLTGPDAALFDAVHGAGAAEWANDARRLIRGAKLAGYQLEA
jgi:hypothetical protein